jgi:hypothetical protein
MAIFSRLQTSHRYAKKACLLNEVWRGRMPRPRNVITGLAATLIVACLLFFATPLAQQSPSTPNPDDPNFDFSIYYTGNVRGNLEPCG